LPDITDPVQYKSVKTDLVQFTHNIKVWSGIDMKILTTDHMNPKQFLQYLKQSCHFPFTHAEFAWILRTIDNYIQAVKANLRLISLNQGKNAMQSVRLSI
jgi:hypothetical protein